MSAPLTPAQCTCIHEPETDAGQVLHASYCVAYTPAPLTPKRLAEIRASIPLEYAPPWDMHHERVDGYWLVGYDTDNPLAGLVAKVPDYGAYLAEFIAEARTAVPELLAEVARLTKRVTELDAAPTRADVLREVEEKIRERAGELSDLAEEEMRRDLEERAQEWHEAANIAARMAEAGESA